MGFESPSNFKREIKIDPLEISLEDCEISIRAYQSLAGLDIKKLKDLCKFTEEELLTQSNRISKKTMQEIKEILAEHGLGFRDLDI